MRNLTIGLMALIAALIIGFSGMASAQPVLTGTLDVTANVSMTCEILSVGTIAFGLYDPIHGGSLSEDAEIQVQCVKGSQYNILLGPGAADGVTYATQSVGEGIMCKVGNARAMVAKNNSASGLCYELYTDVAQTTAWGDDTTNGSSVASAGDGTGQPFTVYGYLPPGQETALEDTYADAVQVTVTF